MSRNGLMLSCYERICSWAKPAKRWPLSRLYTQACFSLSVKTNERKRLPKKFNDPRFVINFLRNLKTFKMTMEKFVVACLVPPEKGAFESFPSWSHFRNLQQIIFFFQAVFCRNCISCVFNCDGLPCS